MAVQCVCGRAAAEQNGPDPALWKCISWEMHTVREQGTLGRICPHASGRANIPWAVAGQALVG